MIPHEIFSLFGSHVLLRFLWAFMSVDLLKGAELVLLAYAAARLFFRRAPGYARTAWMLTLLALLLLPLLWLTVPPLRVGQELAPSSAMPFLGAATPLLAGDRLLGLTNTTGGYIALARQALPGNAPAIAHVLAAAWILGSCYFLTRLLVGWRLARRVAAGPVLRGAEIILAELRLRLAIQRPVVAVASCRCRIPFTCGFLRPCVVLPDEAASWHRGRLRAVLLHEMAHVKRNDTLLNIVAGVVTSLLWCVPSCWIAASFLRKAQEGCADALVIASGMPAAAYASVILQLVRGAPGLLVPSGFQSSFGRAGMMRERIRNVLDAGVRRPRRSRIAAAVPLVVFCCLLPVLAVTCAAGPKAVEGAATLHGTWMNREYFGTYWTHTFVIRSDGSAPLYEGSAVDSPSGEGRFAVERSWVDAEGSTWCFVTYKWCYGEYNEEAASAMKQYWTIRLNPAGDTMDFESSTLTWPAEFGALGGHHWVYYRL